MTLSKDYFILSGEESKTGFPVLLNGHITFIKEKDFKWEDYEDIVEFYREACLTEAERALTIWNETMRLRNTSLKKMYQAAFEEGDTDELVKLDKMLSLTPKMFDDYKKILADYNEEQTKGGNKRKSLSDSGDI